MEKIGRNNSKKKVLLLHYRTSLFVKKYRVIQDKIYQSDFDKLVAKTTEIESMAKKQE
ncbi:MAG: hypothetical protein LBT48_04780 [Prevotellaceae bacterium]|jgi:hypothetical protein|nr:hypothetical protein [Prevotellaceae bacterium]